MQIPLPKGKTVTAKFYKNVVQRKLNKYFKTHCSKTGHKHLRLLHDNAPTLEAHLVAEFLESEKVNVLPHPPDLALCDYYLWRDTDMPLDLRFSVSDGCPDYRV